MDEGKPKKITPIVVEGFEINAQNVSFQKLQEFSLRLYEKLCNVRRERNFLMIDRDKHRTILENCRHEINETKDIANNKESELEQAQEKFRQDLKEVDQEVKYILYDHDIKLNEIETWEKNVLAANAEKNLSEELELLREKRRLKEDLMSRAERNEDELKRLKVQHEEEIDVLENRLEEEQIENYVNFNKSLKKTVENMTLKHEMEMSELEERKNSHFVELRKIHKDRLNEIKHHYNSITAENLAVILSLKQSLDGMKKNKHAMAKEVKVLKKDCQRLEEPLKRTKLEVKKLQKQLVNYEKDLQSLKNNKRLLKETTDQMQLIKKDTLVTKRAINNNKNYNSIEKLNQGCLFPMISFDDCSTHKREILEDLVKEMVEDLDLKQKAIVELTEDPDVKDSLREMHFEFWSPTELIYELAVVCKAHDELLATLQTKLDEFCIPRQEFMESSISYVASYPSGFVFKE